MEDMKASYLSELDELNLLLGTSFFTAEGGTLERAKAIADDLLSFLVSAYTLGILHASGYLDTELTVNTDEMGEAIFALIDGKTFEDRVLDHVRKDDVNGLVNLATSEYHRVYNRAVDNGGKEYARRGNPNVIKTWVTIGDEKVRDTHDYLEGMEVRIGDSFYTWDGDFAAYPGGFTRVENNANCRCIVILSKK